MIEKNLNKDPVENEISEIYKNLQSILEKNPFIIIIGKYDHTLGPIAIYKSVKNDLPPNFIRNLLRDALNTKNKFVILDFSYFYSQLYKIEIDDYNARGKKQLYSIILLRDIEYPLIPVIHFRRIEMMFRKIGEDNILSDDKKVFEVFFEELSDIYLKKNEILPIEKFNLQIRSGINTIQGFCEVILEEKKNKGTLSDKDLLDFIEMMLESCKDIIISLKKYQKNYTK